MYTCENKDKYIYIYIYSHISTAIRFLSTMHLAALEMVLNLSKLYTHFC